MTLCAVPMTLTEAKAFVLSFHRHNKPPQGGLFAVGASDGEALVGVAIVGRPVARKLDKGETVEVTRLCVHEDAPRNACSFLYSRCVRAAFALGWHKVITYTLASEGGASLRGAGWRTVAEIRPFKEGTGWTTRPGREWQAVSGQTRIRWEMAA